MVFDMDIRIKLKDTHDLYTTPLLQQTAYWSSVKAELGFTPLAFDLEVREKDIRPDARSSARLVDDVLVLTRKINKEERIAYVPYGSLLNPDEELQGLFIEALSEELRRVLPPDTILIRYDLPWLKREDEGVTPESEELRLNWGTITHNIRASFTDMLPSNTCFIDLDKQEEDIIANMKSKTRYNIRLAERRGVIVREGDRTDVPIFLNLYKETAERNGIREHNSASFTSLFDSEEDDAKVKLLIAEKDGTPLSALFLSLSDDRASYLYGASSSEGREHMSTYALQKNAMMMAKQMGAKEYDLFGVAPKGEENHPLSGLSRFKFGFGGKRVKRMGCWDYPLDINRAEAFFAEERKWQGYHIK